MIQLRYTDIEIRKYRLEELEKEEAKIKVEKEDDAVDL